MSDPITAVIGGGLSLLGASKSAKAAKSAAAAQSAAADAATAEQARQFDINQANQKPFLQTGTSANQQLGYLLGLGAPGTYTGVNADNGAFGSLSKPFTMADYQADPGYAFRLSEGQKALDRAASAGGKYFSGAAIKGLEAYNQGMASEEFQNAYNRYNTNQTNLYNRLAGVSGAGQTSANQLGNYGMNYANAVGENLMQGANARAAGIVGANNAWSTGLNNIGNNLLYTYGGSSNPMGFANSINSALGGSYFGSSIPGLPWSG